MQTSNQESECQEIQHEVLDNRQLIIVSNRGPFSIQPSEKGDIKFQRNSGGLVSALLGLANRVPSTWIACAMSDEDRNWKSGTIPLGKDGSSIEMRFITPTTEAFQGYYQEISNPLLWFLQHSMWDFSRAPSINQQTWLAWRQGYVAVNQQFADMVAEQVRKNERHSVVMLQDYHLYLAPRMIRKRIRGYRKTILIHFVHIPWPGAEDWGLLPKHMRESILDGLCALDLIGFQTKADALNFIRTCESLLPGAKVNYRRGCVTLGSHTTHVRDFPISIDVKAVRESADEEEVGQYRAQLLEGTGDMKIIARIDRMEPSKNIVRGFQAYEEMLGNHPDQHGKVQFLALMVPSRLEVEGYQEYLNSLMAAAGTVNAKFGTSDWEPVRLLVGESYPRALALMQIYDVLLVNPISDGMNLVAKEGPSVNEKSGVIVLSERAGAHQQLGKYTLVIAPCDISATAEALNTALTMNEDDRRSRADSLRRSIEREDIYLWLCWQLDTIQGLTKPALVINKNGTH